MAYRRPAGDVSLAALHPTITASAGSPDFAMLTDDDIENTTQLPIPASGKSAWIQYTFDQPVTIRAITYAMRNPDHPPVKTLQASEDGVNFRVVVELPDGARLSRRSPLPRLRRSISASTSCGQSLRRRMAT